MLKENKEILERSMNYNNEHVMSITWRHKKYKKLLKNHNKTPNNETLNDLKNEIEQYKIENNSIQYKINEIDKHKNMLDKILTCEENSGMDIDSIKIQILSCIEMKSFAESVIRLHNDRIRFMKNSVETHALNVVTYQLNNNFNKKKKLTKKSKDSFSKISLTFLITIVSILIQSFLIFGFLFFSSVECLYFFVPINVLVFITLITFIQDCESLKIDYYNWLYFIPIIQFFVLFKVAVYNTIRKNIEIIKEEQY